VYLSIGPSVTFIPYSEAYQDITIAPNDVEQGRRFLPEPGVDISENGTRAKINYSRIGDEQWEFGLQMGVFVEFGVPNFLYQIGSNSQLTNSIIIAPYAIIYMAAQDIKERIREPKYWEEKFRPWRHSRLQAGLDIRMLMPF